MSATLVRKMDGTLEPFDVSKLLNSLQSAGASEKSAKEIAKHIESELYNQISTQEIYSHAFEILKKREKKPVAARYSLKRAVLDLGPSGFPFERFVAAMFEELGYRNVKTGVQLQGACASHELDLYALYGDKKVGAEIKFHNTAGYKTDLKVALYVKARFEDLINAKHKIDEGWLITNTRFTRNVRKFAECSGLKLLGWDYPTGSGVLQIMEKINIHPVTALTTLSSAQKKDLLSKDIILCKHLLEMPSSLDFVSPKVKDAKEVLEEVKSLLALRKHS